jgi:uncharacterized protein (TIGR02285 family)
MKGKYLFGAAIILMVAMYPMIGMAEDSITWMEADFVPGYIHDGPLKGQGYEDAITKILQKDLTGYTHQTLIGNMARMTQEFKQGKQVCNVALFKTPEREAFMYFSVPSTFTLPNGLIAKTDKLSLFGNAKTVSLDDVLKGKIKLGISRDRSYGKTIDAVLEKYKNSSNIVVHSGKDVFESLFQMLIRDRVDCMLGLPEEVMYVAEQQGVKDRIASLTLKENENTYDSWLGYVACSKTDWGKQTIGKINRILKTERPTPEYRGAYERWLDEHAHENYRKLYNDIFLKINE